MAEYYKAIPIEEQKPQIGETYFVLDSHEEDNKDLCLYASGKWFTRMGDDDENSCVTHFLQPIEGSPVQKLIEKYNKKIADLNLLKNDVSEGFLVNLIGLQINNLTEILTELKAI